jgi:hypothetical protein
MGGTGEPEDIIMIHGELDQVLERAMALAVAVRA